MVKAAGGDIDQEIVIKEEDDLLSLWCPDSDIASCCDTREEAVKNLADALELYIKTLEKEGELGKDLYPFVT
ncbi:MAG: type II toxin-antitoxin system HicB family antitoxin [Chloroflexota bacterium]